MHRLRRCLPARCATHQRHDQEGLPGLRRVLVLHAVRGGLPDRRAESEHSLSAPGIDMPGVFESYDDLDDVQDQLKAADAGERRVAVIELSHSGDPGAVAILNGMVA